MNALRLALALLVVVSHAWPLNGHPGEPQLGGISLGAWAVLGFFGISGYLITVSRLSCRSAVEFFVARGLRILPGLFVSLLIVAFIFAPLGAALQRGGQWVPAHSVTYVLRNALLYPFGVSQNAIDGTLLGFQFRDWNGPLWTLFYEGVCYVLIGALVGLIGTRRRLTITLASLALILFAAALSHRLDGAFQGLGERIVPMMLAFAVGSLLALTRSRRIISRGLLGAAVLALLASIVIGQAGILAGALLPLLLLVVAGILPLHGIGRRRDVSYGFYIYAWPVQQTLVLVLGWRVSPLLMILLVTACTFPLAMGSYLLVERPSMRSRPVVLGWLERAASVFGPRVGGREFARPRRGAVADVASRT